MVWYNDDMTRYLDILMIYIFGHLSLCMFGLCSIVCGVKYSGQYLFIFFLFTFCLSLNTSPLRSHMRLEYWSCLISHTFDLDVLEEKKCTWHPSHLFFLWYNVMVAIFMDCEILCLYCYAGDRGTAWHAHCWCCNFICIPSHLHSSCPPWSTWLRRPSLGMFCFKLFTHIHVNFLIHTINLTCM